MLPRPVVAFPVHQPAPRQKLQNVVSRLQGLALKRLPAAHQVAHTAPPAPSAPGSSPAPPPGTAAPVPPRPCGRACAVLPDAAESARGPRSRTCGPSSGSSAPARSPRRSPRSRREPHACGPGGPATRLSPRGSCDSRFTSVGSRAPSGSTAIITLSLWTSIPTYSLVLFFIGPVSCSGCDLKRRMWLWHLRSPQALTHDKPAGAGPSIFSMCLSTPGSIWPVRGALKRPKKPRIGCHVQRASGTGSRVEHRALCGR